MSFLCNGCGGYFEHNNEHSCKAIKTDPNDLVMGTLTKREFIAAMVMQGLLADENITGSMAIPTCVKFADALIKELNK